MSDGEPERPSNPFRDREPPNPEDLTAPGVAPTKEAARIGARVDPVGRPSAVETAPEPDTQPDTVRACLDCEVAWVGHAEWAHCPRCGAALEQFEHAEADR